MHIVVQAFAGELYGLEGNWSAWKSWAGDMEENELDNLSREV